MMTNKKRTPMQQISVDQRKTSFKPFLLGYTEEQCIQEANRCLKCLNPLCKKGCPITNDIPDFMKAVGERNFELAYRILSNKTCMPDICGTICPHEKQCEGHCVQGFKGESIAIGAVERFIGEWGAKNLTPTISHQGKGIKVACIGSGPSSLAFAQVLAANGYSVTVYEKEKQAGGVLNWGIPNYRLSNQALANKINLLKNLQVKFVFDKAIDNLADLLKDYQAVFLGIGTLKANEMLIPGRELTGIYQAKDFLSAINSQTMDEEGKKTFPQCGENVVVVGGGNVAIDSARDALRLPQVKKVTIVYRRSENEMPACKEEIAAAVQEGVELKVLTNPVEFQGNNGKVSKVLCALNKLGEPDESGRRKPIETALRITIKADTVVLALGFKPEVKMSDKLQLSNNNCIIVDQNNETSIPNVYAGGDAVSGALTVVSAMKAGINAANHLMQKDKQSK